MNEVIKGDGFYISYNPCPIISSNGVEETALCFHDDEKCGTKYLILDGDYRQEYKSRIESLDDCIAFFESQKDAHISFWSD